MEEPSIQFITVIWEYLRQNAITPYALAKSAGIDNATIYNLIGSKPPAELSSEDEVTYRKPSPENVRRLAKVMDFNPLSLLMLAYPKFAADIRVTPQDYDLVARFRALSEAEQALILRALRKD